MPRLSSCSRFNRFYLACILIAGCSLVATFTSTARAAGDTKANPLSLSVEKDVVRSQISIGAEMSQLTSQTASVVGAGPRVGFNYGLTDKWSLGASMDFSFAATGEPGSLLYSGLNGEIHYAFFGTNLLSTTRVRKGDGGEIVSIVPSAKKNLSAILGLEQLFLNGATSIYPAVGYLVGAVYTFPQFGREFQVDLRYTSLSANNNPLSMIAVGLGINLTL